jgi:hypothetical protein
MPRKKQVQTRIASDTNDQLERYQEERDISQADAVRRLIRSGLANEGYPVAATDGGSARSIEDTTLEKIGSPRTIGIATAIMLLGFGFMLLGAWFAQSNLWWPALASLGIMAVAYTTGAALSATAALAQLALARPLRGLVGIGPKEETTT